MPSIRFSPLSLALLAACSQAQTQSRPLEEVIVSADFRQQNVLDTAISVSVVDAALLQARNAEHMEDVLNLLPNVNFSAGASRGRFFQIRGVGERSQFVDPVNPSVGLIIDGIDFTGLGAAASTLDIRQVEVLRGPQGTRYGANALGGVIAMESYAAHSDEAYSRVGIGDYGSWQHSHAAGAELASGLHGRLAYGQTRSDGYMDNATLNRNDTQNIDERALRGKLQWQVGDEWRLRGNLFLADIDNGYDGFTLDNSRTSLADQPGHDRLVTRAGALQAEYSGWQSLRWQTLLSHANSDTEYGYDEDWTSRGICAETDPCAYWQYSTTDNYLREIVQTSLDTRLVSERDAETSAWVLGLYARRQDEALWRRYVNNDPNYDSFYGPITNPSVERFSSDYSSDNLAAYGQLEVPLAEQVQLVGGLRAEERDFSYTDSQGRRLDGRERLGGGKLALEIRWQDQLAYYQISRGYKAGGNNVPGPVDDQGNDLFPLVFDTEYLWNLELGHKASWLEGRLQSQVAAFYLDRRDMQEKQSIVTSRATGVVGGQCPCDFTDYLDNAAQASGSGLEVELNAALNSAWRLWVNVGWLDVEYREFLSFSHADADSETGTPRDLSGRDVAHAPKLQGAGGLEWEFADGWRWAFDGEYKDAFFLSASHDERSRPYSLWNTRLSWEDRRWEIALWARNLSDKDTIVRGFGGFGNDPRGCDGNLEDGGPDCYPTDAYYQFGAPRRVGLDIAYHW